jgi:hypothetical protein
MEEEDKQYLLQAIFDVINSIDRFSQSRDANVNYQELMLKLDFLQRLLVNMNPDYSICANVGEAYISDITFFSIWNRWNTNPDNRISEGGREVNF